MQNIAYNFIRNICGCDINMIKINNNKIKKFKIKRSPSKQLLNKPSSFFIPFASGKSPSLYFNNSNQSTISLIGFGNCSKEYTKLIRIKNEKYIETLKNQFYFTVPTNCKLKRIVANFSAHQIDIDHNIKLFPCIYIAKSINTNLPFKLIEKTKTYNQNKPFTKSKSCLNLKETIAISHNLNINFSVGSRIAICMAITSNNIPPHKVKANFFCNGSLLFE